MSEQRKIRVTAFQTTHYDRTFDTIEDAAAFLGIPATDITPGWTDPLRQIEYNISDESEFWFEMPYPDEIFKDLDDEGEVDREWSIVSTIPATEDDTE